VALIRLLEELADFFSYEVHIAYTFLHFLVGLVIHCVIGHKGIAGGPNVRAVRGSDNSLVVVSNGVVGAILPH
jgi:hypothetical protein